MLKAKFGFVFLLLILFAFTAVIQAGNSKHKSSVKNNPRKSQTKQTPLWREINENNLAGRENRQTTPEKYRVFRLNETALQAILAAAPVKNANAALGDETVLQVPLPDGKIVRFRLEATNVLAPHLAAEFPTWKTAQGFGIDDPKAIARFDWNAFGFHGYISTEQGTVMIDPYRKGDTSNYLVFYKHDFGNSDNQFYCRAEQKMTKRLESEFAFLAPSAPVFSYGSTLRTFKLAIATTGEWARNAAGYTAGMTPATIRTNALAVITTTVNRLNGIYTRELSSDFQIVNPSVSNDTTNIIFDDPATDPYDNSDGIPQLAINQTTIDTRAGAANYDIGHLYGTGGGGVASSPSLCSAQKAEGYSARGTNTGDPFTVDYVAHEMGHQFGADHTYNNSDPSGACTTRSAADAFEVASGATIMSYVGICNQRNLQQYVDTGFPSFHIRSLTTIITNLTTGDPSTTGCGTASGTNSVPTVNAGNSYNIPKETPFTLTATGGDADGGDVANLLYSWEEYDLAPSASGASGTPAGTYDVDSDSVPRPLFRSYSPISGNSRTFPSLAFILNPANNDPAGSNQPKLTYMGTHPTGFPGAVCEGAAECVVGERLPTINRTMNFRVSLRDRRGGVADAGTTVIVNAAAGPFQLTTQNSLAPEATWAAGSNQTITWDVAGTTANNINAANVKITLSLDGGQSFPVTILNSTPNDGSETITVPNNSTTTARIKIEAIGNIFFDINNANFTITGPTAASVSVSGRVVANGRGVSGARVELTDANGGVRSARTNLLGYFTVNDVPAGSTYVINVSAKRYSFAPQIISVNGNISGLAFLNQP